jgi:hypothetical protein
MSSGKIARYRNYGEVMARHERHLKLKRLMRALVYILILIVLLVISLSYYMVRKLEQQKQVPGKSTSKISQTLK